MQRKKTEVYDKKEEKGVFMSQSLHNLPVSPEPRGLMGLKSFNPIFWPVLRT
jgi:hypothetical protein